VQQKLNLLVLVN